MTTAGVRHGPTGSGSIALSAFDGSRPKQNQALYRTGCSRNPKTGQRSTQLLKGESLLSLITSMRKGAPRSLVGQTLVAVLCLLAGTATASAASSLDNKDVTLNIAPRTASTAHCCSSHNRAACK